MAVGFISWRLNSWLSRVARLENEISLSSSCYKRSTRSPFERIFTRGFRNTTSIAYIYLHISASALRMLDLLCEIDPKWMTMENVHWYDSLSIIMTEFPLRETSTWGPLPPQKSHASQPNNSRNKIQYIFAHQYQNSLPNPLWFKGSLTSTNRNSEGFATELHLISSKSRRHPPSKDCKFSLLRICKRKANARKCQP